jgi:hypothetical protein
MKSALLSILSCIYLMCDTLFIKTSPVARNQVADRPSANNQ